MYIHNMGTNIHEPNVVTLGSCMFVFCLFNDLF